MKRKNSLSDFPQCHWKITHHLDVIYEEQETCGD